MSSCSVKQFLKKEHKNKIEQHDLDLDWYILLIFAKLKETLIIAHICLFSIFFVMFSACVLNLILIVPGLPWLSRSSRCGGPAGVAVKPGRPGAPVPWVRRSPRVCRSPRLAGAGPKIYFFSLLPFLYVLFRAEI